MGRVEGKVAFITGAARGQGRSHAVRLAEEGADIIAVDLMSPDAYPWMTYRQAQAEQLDETVALVEKFDRRIVARKGDVRDRASLQAALDAGLNEFGHVDIVSANAGISPFGPESWNPDPKATVVWGQQVTDEMHSVYMIWTDINDKNRDDNEPIQISPNKAFTTGIMTAQR